MANKIIIKKFENESMLVVEDDFGTAGSDPLKADLIGGKVPAEQLPLTESSVSTFTNKRNIRRLVEFGSTSILSIDQSKWDIVNVTGLSETIAVYMYSSVSPIDGEMICFQFQDDGIARTLTWDDQFVSTTSFTLPTTTVINKRIRVLVQWNSILTKWECVGVVNS